MRFTHLVPMAILLALIFPAAGTGAEVAGSKDPTGTDVVFLLNLAQSGKVEAQVLLAEYYLDRKEYSVALPWLQMAANQGDVEAQRRLALMYETGLGVPRDYARAGFWLRCATKQGDSVAYYKEGFTYSTSAGVP